MEPIGAENSRLRGQKRLRWAIAGMVMVLAIVLGTTFAFVGLGVDNASGANLTASQVTTANSGATVVNGDDSGGLASPAQEVATELGPSVVNIAISGTSQGQQYAGEGSGVIYTKDGMIITNNHVASDESGNVVQNIEVTLATGEKLPATVVGRDPLTDLAVIKVDAGKNLPAATFDTHLPAVGEYAIAIGSPMGYENSVTLGIVSGIARSIEGVGGTEGVALTNLIQTDAPISPGNSGGALGNASGEVIGINVAYLPPGETGAVNIGFAIPAVTATQIADQIVETGSATHAYLGVGTQTVTPDLQQQFALSRSSGVLVAEVTAGGPAEKAGIQQGDIITKIDDQDMTESSNLMVAIRDKQPGDTVQVSIDRNGTTQVVTVTLEERPTGM
jgi:serine protease DegQ